MHDTKTKLLDGVKATVARYGLAEFSTRKLSEVSGINNGLIYHYFKSKNDVLLQAYCRENSSIFAVLLHQLDEVSDIPFDFQTKARLWFHKVWREFLSDSDRIFFCSAYYHSIYFQSAGEFHTRQVDQLLGRIGAYFKRESDCVQTMYSLMTILYDSAMRATANISLDTPEFEESIFAICYGALSSQITNIETHEVAT